MTRGITAPFLGEPPAPKPPTVVRGFLPSVLNRIHGPDVGLVVWQRFTRLNLFISAGTLLMRPPFTETVVGTPDMAARRICRNLQVFHWPLFGDFRRLGVRFANLASSPLVKMRFEHVTNDSCRKFHVDAVGLRLLCTYAGPGTEWLEADGTIRRMASMEVAIFKGAGFAGDGLRVLHRSPPLSAGTRPSQSRARAVHRCRVMTEGATIRTRQVQWSWHGQAISLGIDEAGDGAPVLLLPALSSISTRREMHPLMQWLAGKWRLIAVDWPGFGDLPRPPVIWTPDALSAFLEWFVREQVPALHGTIAAGHAATYALHLAAEHPGIVGRLALLAPTWRGPLPTMAGGDPPVFSRIRRAIELPLIGPALYQLNVNPLVVRMMLSGHVYSDARQLSAEQTRDKQKVIAAEGARFASAAFVTGGLDRVRSREAFLALARRAQKPLLVAYGADTPRKSRAEMDALAGVEGVQSLVAPKGKLGFHEEYPEVVCPMIEAVPGRSGIRFRRRRSGS